MDSARQLLRWSVPGFILVFNAVALQAFWLTLVEGRSMLTALSGASGSAVFGIIASSIPVGFIVYQVYYFRYKAVGGLWPLRYIRRDRGGVILDLYLNKYGGRPSVVEWVDVAGANQVAGGTRHDVLPLCDRVEPPAVKRKFRVLLRLRDHICPGSSPSGEPINCKDCRSVYTKNFNQNWTLAQSVLDYCSAVEVRRWIKQEYTVGSDIYHSLGASRVAITLSAVGVAAYDLLLLGSVRDDLRLVDILNEDPWRIGKVAIAWVVLFVVEVLVLWRCRHNVLHNYEERVAAGLAFVSKDLGPGS